MRSDEFNGVHSSGPAGGTLMQGAARESFVEITVVQYDRDGKLITYRVAI